MGLKNVIDAANRYAENSDILDKVAAGEIEHSSPENKQQWNYFVSSNDSADDTHTIFDIAVKNLKANGKEVNSENLQKFFDNILQVYESKEQSSSPEQIQDLEKESTKNIIDGIQGVM